METEKFEEVLKSGDTLAECFKDYSDATKNLESAREQFRQAQHAVEIAVQSQEAAARAYDDAKLALIGSVEAL